MQNKLTWKPRWYYIKANKNTGKLYIGQTTKANIDAYLGSGNYWTNHGKKWGGYNRENIATISKWWITSKEDADSLCKWFEDTYGEYWLSTNSTFLNRVPENSSDNALTGVPVSSEIRAATSTRCQNHAHMTEEQRIRNRVATSALMRDPIRSARVREAVSVALTDLTIYEWTNLKDGRTFTGIRKEFKALLEPLGEWSRSSISGIIHGKRKHHKGWSLVNQ